MVVWYCCITKHIFRKKTEENWVHKRQFWTFFNLLFRKGRNGSIHYSHGKVTYVFPGDCFNQNRSSLVIPYSSAPGTYDDTGESTMQILSAIKANSSLGCIGWSTHQGEYIWGCQLPTWIILQLKASPTYWIRANCCLRKCLF